MRNLVLSITIGGLVVLCLVVGLGMFVIRALWGWVVPDLFPGAVASGAVASEIGWWTAFKLGLILALLNVFTRSCRTGQKVAGKRVHVSAARSACRDNGAEVIDATVTNDA